MNIRLATKDDLPRIVEIYNQAVAVGGATGDLSPVTVESKAAWFGEHAPDTHPIWVAEDDGVVVGWCSLSPYRTGRMAFRFTAEISYYVDEGQRGKGLGTQLIKHALDQCPSLGLKSLFGLILEVNVGSVRILERFGFEKWGHMPAVADINGRECGHVIYGRRVCP